MVLVSHDFRLIRQVNLKIEIYNERKILMKKFHFRLLIKFGFVKNKKSKNGPVIFSVTKNIYGKKCKKILLQQKNKFSLF